MNGKEEILAPCGIDCIECPAYKATRENDYGRIADILRDPAIGDAGYEPEDLICDGCHRPRLFKWCRECAIRDCCVDRVFKTCAECEEYPCDRLSELWEKFGEAGAASKANLDGLKG